VSFLVISISFKMTLLSSLQSRMSFMSNSMSLAASMACSSTLSERDLMALSSTGLMARILL
jgi:hypothetical protein